MTLRPIEGPCSEVHPGQPHVDPPRRTDDPERLARGIAYALARAALPTDGDTARDYALVLAPLVIESGWLAAPDPEGLPSVKEIRRRHSFADGRLQHPDDCPDEDHRDDLHDILARLTPESDR